MPLFSTQHRFFWAVFLFAAAVCLALALLGLHRRALAIQTADILRPLIAADSRFQRVVVAVATNARVILEGSVSSDADISALRQLVEQAHVPSQPIFGVRFGAMTRWVI
jgi:ABC-type enterobactin transport system permease subunit